MKEFISKLFDGTQLIQFCISMIYAGWMLNKYLPHTYIVNGPSEFIDYLETISYVIIIIPYLLGIFSKLEWTVFNEIKTIGFINFVNNRINKFCLVWLVSTLVSCIFIFTLIYLIDDSKKQYPYTYEVTIFNTIWIFSTGFVLPFVIGLISIKNKDKTNE